MLFKEAADERTWDVLDRLMHIPELDRFHLAGGTALALRFGHRLSIDLDMFTDTAFDKSLMFELLSDHFGDVKEVKTGSRSMYFALLNGIKTDFVHQGGNMISAVEHFDSIRLWGIEDACGMKMNAIYGRGSKKDFWDLDLLLDKYDLTSLVSFFLAKSPHAFEEGMILSLITFDEADKQADPFCLRPRAWTDIKARIRSEVWKHYRV